MHVDSTADTDRACRGRRGSHALEAAGLERRCVNTPVSAILAGLPQPIDVRPGTAAAANVDQ
jgi:hypothetical protein